MTWINADADEARAGFKAWLGCVVAGGIVLGLGSRLVMRVIAVMAEPQFQGAATSGGNVVGAITLKGTLGMFIPGAFGGAIAGGVYLLIRRWMPRGVILRGICFGVVTLVLFWGLLVGSSDFRFTSAGPQVAMFAALFPIFGVLSSALAERWGVGLPAHRPTTLGYAALVAVVVGGIAYHAGPTMIARYR